MEITRAEVISLVEPLGSVNLSQVDAPIKRALVTKLFNTDLSTAGVTSVILTNIDGFDRYGYDTNGKDIVGITEWEYLSMDDDFEEHLWCAHLHLMDRLK